MVNFPNQDKEWGRSPRITSPGELGDLARTHRKACGLTLQDISDSTRLGLRFLSEFERGKPNASLGRVLQALEALGLDVLVLPRERAGQLLRTAFREPPSEPEQ